MTNLSRRTLLLGAGAGALTGFPDRKRASDAQIYGVPTINPLIEQRADPFITQRIRGWYYFTGSVPEYDRLVTDQRHRSSLSPDADNIGDRRGRAGQHRAT